MELAEELLRDTVDVAPMLVEAIAKPDELVDTGSSSSGSAVGSGMNEPQPTESSPRSNPIPARSIPDALEIMRPNLPDYGGPTATRSA